MATSWDSVNYVFFHKIEEDSSFFDYFNLEEEEASALATERADAFLIEAAARLNLVVSNGTNFLDFDEDEREFNFDLTGMEVYLLACLQYENYLSRGVARLKNFTKHFVPTDLNVFAPQGDRASFLALYETVKRENQALLDDYRSKDRLTNEKLEIDYSSYNEE